MPHAPTRSLDFAPVSGAPSTLRRIAAGYLMLSGGVALVFAIGGAVAAALGSGPFAGQPLVAVGLAISVTMALALLWAGREIWRGEQRGVYGALALILLPPVVNAAQGLSMSLRTVVWTALGVVVLVLVWRDIARRPTPLG